jgi:hypothetical protein
MSFIERRLASSRPLTTLAIAIGAAFAATGCGGGSDAPAATDNDTVAAAAPAEHEANDYQPLPLDLSGVDGAEPIETPEEAQAAAAAAEVAFKTFGAAADDSASEATPAVDDLIVGAAAASTCEIVPATVPNTSTRSARDWGAVPNDSGDDTAALQRALDSLSYGQGLQLESGVYRISKSLHIRKAGLTLKGAVGATIHGTNPDDQAVLIEADNVTVRNLTFTAVTDGRRSAPRHARIAVARGLPNYAGYGTVRNTTIRDNRIIAAGAPGTSTANSASTVGILLLNADRFLIAKNTISRTLADGIHMTLGSRNGRVLQNTVQQTGDDQIAIVSYRLGGNPVLGSASAMKADWDAQKSYRYAHNILVAGNSVSAPYWGRGLSVIGAEKVTLARNKLDNMPLTAGILIAREAVYQTFGTKNVLVEGNTLRNLQNQNPPYQYKNIFSNASRTGHGGVEIHAALWKDEAADSFLRDTLSVRDVMVRGNSVTYAKPNAIRAGTQFSRSMTATNSSGNTVTRTMTTGITERLSAQSTQMNSIWNVDAMTGRWNDQTLPYMQCSSNLRDGKSYQPSFCRGSTPSVSGAVLACSSDGKLL